MTGFVSFPSVVAASPATSRAHVYSATVSWKNAISSALSEIAADRRCSVSTSARPSSGGRDSLGSAAGRGTSDSRRLHTNE